MKEFLSKMIALEQETAIEKGGYSFFAIFMRSYFPQRWDITVSASWIDDDKGEALKYLVSKVKRLLNKDEFSLLSAIVMIKTSDPALFDLHAEINIKDGPVELKNFEFARREIESAYIITSMQNQVA